MHRLLTLTVALALSAAPLAAAPRWTALGPFGGFVDSLTVDPIDSRVLYVTSTSNGTFKSTDGGATWGPIHAGVGGSVAVDPSRHTTIYQAWGGDRVLKSNDGGATWSESTRGLPDIPAFDSLAVDPAKRTRIYLGGFVGVWRSLDGGTSWRPARTQLQSVRVLVASPRPAGTVYAATTLGLFKSVDGGDSWKLASRGLPPGAVTTLALAPSDPATLWVSIAKAGIFRSTNGGASWSLTADQPEGAGNVLSLAISPRNSRTAWVSLAEKGVSRTLDGGAHWTPAGPQLGSACCLAAGGSTLYAGVDLRFLYPGGVLASSDGGITWQPRNHGLAALYAMALALDPHHPEVLWAANGSLYRSTDRGRTWELSPQPPNPPAGPISPAAFDVALSADGAVVYAVWSTEAWASQDVGNSWHRLLGAGTTPPSASFVLTQSPDDPATLYSGASPEPYVSHDAGATWKALKPGFACSFATLAVAPSAPSTLYAGGSKKSDAFGCGVPDAALHRSTDGGATWTPADAGLTAQTVISLAVDPVDSRTLFAGAIEVFYPEHTGVWKSTDGGATWVRTGTGLPGQTIITNVAISRDGKTVWASSSSQVFASHDDGATWEPAGGPQAYIARLLPDLEDPRRLYAVTTGGIWVLEP